MVTIKKYKPILIFLSLLLANLSCTNSSTKAPPVPRAEQREPTVENAAEDNSPAETPPDTSDGSSSTMTPDYPSGPGSGGRSRRSIRCGDGILGRGEECDDGNRNDDDNCSLQCTIKDGSPECSWLCDDPQCPAICDPVCEPPRCHTSCQEVINPPNCTCQAKCEKPECEIKCPDSGCEVDGCPACTTICKDPHCVVVCEPNEGNTSGCEAPTPQCGAQCDAPNCDWKCHKPACPKPKCELECEEPRC